MLTNSENDMYQQKAMFTKNEKAMYQQILMPIALTFELKFLINANIERIIYSYVESQVIIPKPNSLNAALSDF